MAKLKYTEEQIVKRLPIGISILEKPTIIRRHYLFSCNKCGHEWRTRLDHVLDNHGCPICNRAIKYTDEEVNDKIKEFNLVLCGSYVENQTKAKFKCLKCQTIFEQLPLSIFIQHAGCPVCRPTLYKNQKLTGKFLREILGNEICITPNYYVKKPVYYKKQLIKKYVYVDFAFTKNDILYFIEYHGVQHYKPIRFFNLNEQAANHKFFSQTIRDKWLRRYCKREHIILIEIDGRKIKGDKIKDVLENKLYQSGHIFPGSTLM